MKDRILVVDDEKDLAEALTERLQIRGYDATCSFSATDALEKIALGNFDVVLLDLIMPEMDGLEALISIKKVKPRTEIIMLSGLATLEMAIEGMQKGAFEYLTKPSDTSVIVDKVNAALQRKREHEKRIINALEKIKQVRKEPE